MTKSFFDELANQYNMHLKHIGIARDSFEGQAREFFDYIIDEFHQELKVKGKETDYLGFDPAGSEENVRQTSLTSFHVRGEVEVKVKRSGNQRFTRAGALWTGIEYSHDLHCFIWYLSFTNNNKVHDQIDEECFKIAQSKDHPLKKYCQQIKSDEFVFFAFPIDKEFPLNTKELIHHCITLLDRAVTTLNVVGPQIAAA